MVCLEKQEYQGPGERIIGIILLHSFPAKFKNLTELKKIRNLNKSKKAYIDINRHIYIIPPLGP